MSNVIEVDFTPPEKTFEQMLQEAMSKYKEPELVAQIGDTSVWKDEHFVQVKVDDGTVLCFARKDGGLNELVKALQSTVQ